MSEFETIVDAQVAPATLETSTIDGTPAPLKITSTGNDGSSENEGGLTVPLASDLDEDAPTELYAALERLYIAARYQGDSVACTQLLAAADAGNHLAEAYISIMYSVKDCRIIPADPQKSTLFANRALPWLQTEAASINQFALFAQGWLYQKGGGVTKDEQEAVRHYTLAAEQGNAAAQFNLGELLVTFGIIITTSHLSNSNTPPNAASRLLLRQWHRSHQGRQGSRQDVCSSFGTETLCCTV